MKQGSALQWKIASKRSPDELTRTSGSGLKASRGVFSSSSGKALSIFGQRLSAARMQWRQVMRFAFSTGLISKAGAVTRAPWRS